MRLQIKETTLKEGKMKEKKWKARVKRERERFSPQTIAFSRKGR